MRCQHWRDSQHWLSQPLSHERIAALATTAGIDDAQLGVMETKEPRPLVPIALVVATLLLLPVFAIIVGFNLVPLIAFTAGSRTAWIVVAGILAAVVIAGLAYVI